MDGNQAEQRQEVVNRGSTRCPKKGNLHTLQLYRKFKSHREAAGVKVGVLGTEIALIQ